MDDEYFCGGTLVKNRKVGIFPETSIDGKHELVTRVYGWKPGYRADISEKRMLHN